MKLGMAAAVLTLIGAASLITPSYSSAQDAPPSVQVPPSQSGQPSNIRSGAAQRGSAEFSGSRSGSATGASAMVPVAQRFAPTTSTQPPSSAANNR
jgi:hypothetical protein